MLEIESVTKVFQGKPALKNVNMVVADGAIHSLMGSSGSGKTTLLRVMLGLIPFDQGHVKINDRPLLSLTRKEWADQIGYVPQDYGLFPHLTGKGNVSLVAKLRGWSKSQIDLRRQELAVLVGLDPMVLERFPHEMSGGQQQRVSIMRAVFMNPAVMLLDEPMGALDPMIRRTLQEELKFIFERLRKTVVLVTHDLGEAVFFSDQITLLHEGRVIQTGTYHEFLRHPTDPLVSRFIKAQRNLPEVTEFK